MKLLILAIGKAKPGPERELYAEYIRRLLWKVELKELELKKDLPAQKRKEEEGALLLAAAGKARIIALDEHGKTLSSREFATEMKRAQDEAEDVAFVIGGADGLAKEVLARAKLSLSFGRMSWPHMLVRPMLAEQLYRAHTLLTGHPYHRD